MGRRFFSDMDMLYSLHHFAYMLVCSNSFKFDVCETIRLCLSIKPRIGPSNWLFVPENHVYSKFGVRGREDPLFSRSPFTYPQVRFAGLFESQIYKHFYIHLVEF